MFGNWVNTKRKEKGWTQAELSIRSGIPQTTISGWETGKILSPSVKHLPVLKEVFKVRICDIPIQQLEHEGVIDNGKSFSAAQ